MSDAQRKLERPPARRGARRGAGGGQGDVRPRPRRGHRRQRVGAGRRRHRGGHAVVALDYEAMTLDDLVVVDLDGEVVAGERSPTSREGRPPGDARRLPRGRSASCTATPSTPRCSRSPASPSPPPSTSSSSTSAATSRSASTTRGQRQAWRPRSRPTLGDRSAVLMANHGHGGRSARSVDDALHSAAGRRAQRRDHVGRPSCSAAWSELPEKARTDFAGVYDFIRNHMWNPDRRTGPVASVRIPVTNPLAGAACRSG